MMCAGSYWPHHVLVALLRAGTNVPTRDSCYAGMISASSTMVTRASSSLSMLSKCEGASYMQRASRKREVSKFIRRTRAKIYSRTAASGRTHSPLVACFILHPCVRL